MSIKQLVSQFGPAITKDDSLIEKLKSLQEIFSINEEDLHLHWETFNVTKAQEDLDLTVENLERLQEYIQSQIASRAPVSTSLQASNESGSSALKRKPMIRQPIVSSSPSQASNPNSNGAVPSTPSLKRRRVVEETPYKTPGTKFESSPVPGEYATANNTFQSPTPQNAAASTPSNSILESLNPSAGETLGYVQLEEDPSTAIKPFKLTANFDPSKFKFRTMSMKLLESADVLDEQIDSVSQLVQQSKKVTSEFGNPCLSTQFPIYCCGRIVPDSPLYDASQVLNASALFLETSRFGGIGQRVPLDLSNISEYSLFPGQIVCLKGTNPTARAFIVEEIVDLPELGAPVSSRAELDEYYDLTESSNGLRVMYVAGPYSNSHNLNYKKFETLVDRINSEIKPHTVVLFGPFVDISNTAVSKGEIEVEGSDANSVRTLDDVFKKFVVPIIKKINSRISVIMIPSLKDACIKHCSYPQDSFNRKQFGLPKNVKIFPNPSSFAVNEAIIGVSNLDIFKDLKDVYKANSDESQISSNRFERISNHIFDQRRYYPVVPGSIKKRLGKDQEFDELTNGFMNEELSEVDIGGSSLEVPYMGLTELGDALPDVLVIPSELKYFAKVIRGVVVINPGYFIRPNSNPTREDGSYVIMNIQAPHVGDDTKNVKKAEGGDLYYHNVCERSRVDILKS